MSNTARKARKRAGEKLIRLPKVGTPLLDRAVPTVVDQGGRISGPAYPHLSRRVATARAKVAKALGITKADEEEEE